MAVNFTQASGSNTVLEGDYGEVPTLPLTLCAWVNFSTGSVPDLYIVAMSKRAGGPSNYTGYRMVLSGRRLKAVQQFISFGIAFNTVTGSTDLPLDEWVHLVAVFTGSGTTCTGANVYVDGALDGSNTWNRDITDSLAKITIGGAAPAETAEVGWVGCVANGTIYQGALSVDEIGTLAAGRAPGVVQPGSRIIDVPMVDDATAGDNLVGDAFTAFEDSPDGLITDCPDAPPLISGGSSAVRIMG